MAENIKDPIDKLAELRNVPREEIVKELRELDLGAVQPDGSRSGGFAELYQKGIFNPEIFKGDLAAHEAFGKALGSDPDLMRAFDYYKKTITGGKGIQEIIEEAGDSFGAGNRRELEDAMPWNGEVQAEFKNRLLSPYGFIALSDGTYSAPWLKEQAQEKIGPAFQESDAERKERERKEALEDMRAKREEQQAQARAIALDRDPEARILRQQNAQLQDDPFLYGTGGLAAQTDRLLDRAGRQKPLRNYSDARLRAKQDLDMDNRAFVASAARENLRRLDRIGRARRATVDNNFDNMMQWTLQNPEHEMAKRGPNNWTDQEKIKFVHSLNLGRINLDKPAATKPAPTPVDPAAPAPSAPVANNNPTPAPAPAAPQPQVSIEDPAAKKARRSAADEAYADWQSRYGEGVRERKAFMDQRMQDREQEIDADRLAKAERRANADKAYADWQSRYGEKAREREAFMDQRMQDREQEIKAKRQAAQAEAAPRPGQPASEPRTVHDVFRDERVATENAPSVHDVMSKMSFMEQAPNAVPQQMTASSLPPQDPFESSELNAFTDLEEAGKIESLRNQLADVNRQKETALKNAAIVQEHAARQAAQKATLAGINESQRLATERNLTDTKKYYDRAHPTYGKRNDGSYGVLYDPRSYKTMKERSQVMEGMNNSQSGNPFQDFMDETREEQERKRRQQAFASQSKATPFYKNIFG